MEPLSRLREERLRLGMDQATLGGHGGVKALAQRNYENGKRFPDARYLSAVAAVGVDVLYVITGQRAFSEADLDVELEQYGKALEVVEMALQGIGKNLAPGKKRRAVDILYRASKSGAEREEDALSVITAMAA